VETAGAFRRISAGFSIQTSLWLSGWKDIREKPYVFISVETLVADFLSDIEKIRGGTQ
jgi:hypothetical protein